MTKDQINVLKLRTAQSIEALLFLLKEDDKTPTTELVLLNRAAQILKKGGQR